MSIFDTIKIIKPCSCHFDTLLKHKTCICGSYYGDLDDDMCRICESIHCECWVGIVWSNAHYTAEWERKKWEEKEARYGR